MALLLMSNFIKCSWCGAYTRDYREDPYDTFCCEGDLFLGPKVLEKHRPVIDWIFFKLNHYKLYWLSKYVRRYLYWLVRKELGL
jgi:hypothetical protein